MSSGGKVTRRSFLKSSVVTASAAVGTTARLQRAVAGANERIHIGVIGTGWIARGGHLAALRGIRDKENFTFVAINDVWKKRMDSYAEIVKKDYGAAPAKFSDYRELLEMKEIDSVLIATPEHWHGRQILDALEAGKHIYTEKPMTHTIDESVKVLEAAKKSDRLIQVGIQGMSDDSYEAARKYIKSGKLGRIVHAQIDYVRWYAANSGPWRTDDGRKGGPKPPDLDWDAWLGPARKVPWDARRYFDWRCYWDYSGGICTDLFVHRIARLMRALELAEPTRACGFGGIFMWDDGRDTPDNFEMCLEYPRGMTIHVLGTMGNSRGIEHVIRGHRASLVFTGGGFEVYPMDPKLGKRDKPIYTHKKTGAEDQALHHINHWAAIRANKPEMLACPVSLGHAAVTAVCMANESYRSKKYMAWDAEKKTMRES